MAPGVLASARGAAAGWRLALGGVLAASFLHSWQRAFLIDDAYISFRYARNLVEGNGLVFNIGERVEGYTNFLWTLLMALASEAGVDPSLASQAAGMTASLLLLIVAHRWGRDLGLGRGWALVAPGMLALNRSYAAWATGGLETRFFSLLLVASAWRLHVESRLVRRACQESPPGRSPGVLPVSALLLALACLTRPEGLLAAAVAAGGLLASLRDRHHQAARAHLTGWISILLLVVGGHVAWRRGYYGAWLPNSFHAKVPGPRVVSGALYLLEFARYHLALPAACVAAALVQGRARLRERLRVTPAGAAGMAGFALPFTVLYLAYTCVVGGDHFEFRFLDPVLPFLYMTAALLTRPLPAPPGATARGRLGAPAAAGILAAALVMAGGVSSLSGFTDVDREFRLGGRSHYLSVVSTETESLYLDRWRKIGQWFHRHADPSDSIAVAPAGAIPYFSGLRTLDMLGINDRQIARLPAVAGRNVGHERWADPEIIRSRGITYLIGSPRIQPFRQPDLPGNPVEVRLGGDFFYFWVLAPRAAIAPGSTWAP